jgi:aminoglycoside phosphotransferase (APT) family kinase protein
MHIDELEIDETLARRLLADQFPEWGDLPLRRIEPGGTVNAIFRLGDVLALRLPRLGGPTKPGSKELDWLPKLAPLLPVEVPVPVAQGRPSDDYPWFWEVHRWVEGATVPMKEIDAIQAARDLASLVGTLQEIDPDGAPPGRGIPLAERDRETRSWLARFRGPASRLNGNAH